MEPQYVPTLGVKKLEHGHVYDGQVELNTVTGEFSVEVRWQRLSLRTLKAETLNDLEAQFHQLCGQHERFRKGEGDDVKSA